MGTSDYYPVQERRAVTNLSSSRYERALGLVTTYLITYSMHNNGPPGRLPPRLLLITETRVKGQAIQCESIKTCFQLSTATGAIKKPQVLKGSKKAEIFYFPSCQNSSLCRKDNPLHPCPIFGYICSMDATMDLCCLRKQQKENTDRERERVPVSNLLAI